MTPYSLPPSYIAYQKFSLSIRETRSSNCIYVFTGTYDTKYYHVEESKLHVKFGTIKFFPGELAKLREATISFVMSVRPSTWNNSASTWRIFIKYDTWIFFENVSKKNQNSLKSDKNKVYFTWRPICIFEHNSLSSL